MTVSDRVIVFGGNHHNTLGVIRSLGQKGISTILILVDDDDRQSYVSKSKYIAEVHKYPSYESGVKYLADLVPSLKEKLVVICCSDGAASAVDMHYDVLASSFYIPNCAKRGEISRLMSKEVLADEAKNAGLAVPQTWLSENGVIPDGVTFPCILKPLYSKDGRKEDISVCRDLVELTNYFQNEHCNRLQIQAFVEKDFEYQLIGCSIRGGGQVIIPGVSKVIRPSKTSNTGFLLYDRLDNTYPIQRVKDMLSKMKYSGLFSAEFLRDKEGKDYFMEVNFRNDGNAIAVTAAGVNLPFLWVQSSLSDNPIDTSALEIHPVYVMPEYDDLVHVLHHNISLKTWIKDMKRSDCYMEYDKADKKPFFYRTKDMVSVLLKKVFRR